MKYLRISIEQGPSEGVIVYEPLDGNETEEELEQQAADYFHNYCSYGFSVVDESEVPKDER